MSGANEAARRGDGFGGERKLLFLAALRYGHSVLAACRLVGISSRTAYNHRRGDRVFARDWALARRMAFLPLEMVAWIRAVEGVEEPVYCYGKLSHVRQKPSDALLVRLLASEDPERFGRSAGARTQGKLARRMKRLAQKLEALEARVEKEERMRGGRNSEAVNFVKFAAGPAVPRGRRRSWRLDRARRRVGGPGISTDCGKS